MNYNSHFAYLHVAGEEEKQNGGKKRRKLPGVGVVAMMRRSDWLFKRRWWKKW
jgi:hypothetical protein